MEAVSGTGSSVVGCFRLITAYCGVFGEEAVSLSVEEISASVVVLVETLSGISA